MFWLEAAPRWPGTDWREQYPVALLPLMAAVSAAPAPGLVNTGSYQVATVQPYLGPLCQVTNVALGLLCKFDRVTLAAGGECTNIGNTCAVHYPTSFTAQLSEAPDLGTTCRVSVWAKRDCGGAKAQTGPLTGKPSMCSNSLFPQKLVEGGQVSHPLEGPLLPFGFESLKLECA